MTFNIGHVSGGTNAGWKRVGEEVKEPWTCNCGDTHPPTWVNCPNCGVRNPGK